MNRLLNFKSIRSKMLLAFSLILILIVILTSYNFYSVNGMNKKAQEVKEVELPILMAYQE